MDSKFLNERLAVVLRKLNVTNFEAKNRIMRHTFNTKGIAGGVVDVLDNETKRKIGFTDFDGNKLPKGHYLVINSVAAYSENTAATPNLGTWAGTPNAVMLNSNLIVHQGKTVIETAMQALFNVNAGKSSKGDDFYPFADGNVLLPEEEYVFKINAPAGVADATDKWVMLAFDVFLIIDKDVVKTAC